MNKVRSEGYSGLGRGVWVSSSPMNTLEPQIMAISAGRLSLLSSLHYPVVFLTVGGVTVVGTPLSTQTLQLRQKHGLTFF